MADPTKMKQMSNADLEKLSDVQKMYIKRLERFNKSRASVLVEERGVRRYLFAGLTLVVFGTYFYTMFAVKQEKLGDAFDQRYDDKETEKVADSSH